MQLSEPPQISAQQWAPELAPAPESAIDRVDLAYFEAQLAENTAWSHRMGVELGTLFRHGARVLEFGCGHGALATQGAASGAWVTGIDISARRIAFAERHTGEAYPALRDRLEFVCGAVQDLPGEARFDAVVSKDTFEHAVDLPAVLFALRRLLRPGGLLYTGFSPLWFSPFGDHGFLTRRRLPWAHLVLGEAAFLEAHNAHTGRPDGSIAAAGFNRMTPADFRAAFSAAGFVVERVRVNAASPLKRLAFAPLDALRRVPALEKFATISMYLKLRLDAAKPVAQ